MGYLVWINSLLVPAEEARISVFDAAYLYGEGLFETLLAHEGTVLFFDEHLERLLRGCRMLGIPLPLKKGDLKKGVFQALAANGLRNAYIRIGVSAEEEEVGARRRHSKETDVVIFTKPPDPYPDSLYKRGCRLIVVRSTPNDPPPLATIKSTNFLTKNDARFTIRIADKTIDQTILVAPFFLTTNGGGFIIGILTVIILIIAIKSRRLRLSRRAH